MTIAFVESATAGRVCSEFSLTNDSGKNLVGGLVCYDASLKEDLLGIPTELIQRYTPESAEVTKALAEHLRKLMKADIYVAVTGLTTPGGSETSEKPVGTMFIHVCVKEQSIPFRKTFQGNAQQIILKTVDSAARLIIDALKAITTENSVSAQS